MVTLFLFLNGEALILVGSMDAVIKQLRMLCPDGPVIDVFSQREGAMSVARIVRDAPDVYHGTKALSKSSMDELLRCPARFKVTFDAMGSGDHDQTAAMLEAVCSMPWHLNLTPFQAATINAFTTGPQRPGRRAVLARGKGLELVKAGMWDECAAMSEAARAHPLFIAASRSGTFITETSIYWQEGPVPCKRPALTSLLSCRCSGAALSTSKAPRTQARQPSQRAFTTTAITARRLGIFEHFPLLVCQLRHLFCSLSKRGPLCGVCLQCV